MKSSKKHRSKLKLDVTQFEDHDLKQFVNCLVNLEKNWKSLF